MLSFDDVLDDQHVWAMVLFLTKTSRHSLLGVSNQNMDCRD